MKLSSTYNSLVSLSRRQENSGQKSSTGILVRLKCWSRCWIMLLNNDNLENSQAASSNIYNYQIQIPICVNVLDRPKNCLTRYEECAKVKRLVSMRNAAGLD